MNNLVEQVDNLIYPKELAAALQRSISYLGIKVLCLPGSPLLQKDKDCSFAHRFYERQGFEESRKYYSKYLR